MSLITDSRITVSLVIPVYNNEKTLISQLKACEDVLKKNTDKFEIITSDDKSTDGSAKLLIENFGNNKNFLLVFNKNNLGIAKNIKKLYSLARHKYICLYSADGDWDPNDIKKLITHAHKNKLAIIIGKRNKETYSSYRKIVSYFYNLLPRLIFGIDAIDAGSIKAFERSLYKSLPNFSSSVFFETEFIIRAIKRGKKIGYVPISFKKQKINKGFGGKISYVLSSLKDLIILRFRI